MNTYSIADAKARFSELIARAEAGTEVVITRRGRPVVRMQAMKRRRKPVSIAELKAFLGEQPVSNTPSVRHIRALRDEAR